jgi:hypothetical protein
LIGVLAGVGNFRQLGSHAADIPQPLLAKLGATWNSDEIAPAVLGRVSL